MPRFLARCSAQRGAAARKQGNLNCLPGARLFQAEAVVRGVWRQSSRARQSGTPGFGRWSRHSDHPGKPSRKAFRGEPGLVSVCCFVAVLSPLQAQAFNDPSPRESATGPSRGQEQNCETALEAPLQKIGPQANRAGDSSGGFGAASDQLVACSLGRRVPSSASEVNPGSLPASAGQNAGPEAGSHRPPGSLKHL